MKRSCKASGVEFEISEAQRALYQKLGFGLPTLCPLERHRRRIAIRNFRSLTNRTCDATGQQIISMYHSEVPFPVYHQNFWWSDEWDARSYAREFDFSRPFFEQYAELSSRVPRYHVMNMKSENCGYTNMTNFSKDCYLVFGCVQNQDCMYGHIVWNSEHCLDSLYLYRCQWCSNSVDLVDCYDVHYSTECNGCSESYFLHDCRSCRNCFACVGMRNRQYCFANEQLSKTEYGSRLRELFPLSRSAVTEWDGWLTVKRAAAPYPPRFGTKYENAIGDHLVECKDIFESFDIKIGESLAHCYTVRDSSNSSDLSFTGYQEFSIECVTSFESKNALACHLTASSYDVAYSEFCISSHDLFGCNGLRNAEYCILNQQYSKQDYKALREKIIAHMRETGEWGEFFPIEHSPFAYNESIVSEYFPLAKEEVLKRGWRWKDNAPPAVGEARPTPEQTAQLSPADLEKPFTSRESGKSYKILPQEFAIYQKLGLPPPSYTPDERHEQRMTFRKPRELHDCPCSNCRKPLRTIYQSERVFCEDCYLARLHS